MSPEQSIAHYRIVSKLGEGGMGAVYRATDTKLGREVAIKVLPEGFASDAARMARFEREAQVLASLNHPNIAAIYGIEQGALVMELVEGPDLAGPVPVVTAIAYAKQIAAGLEAAHEKSIVHRDLKPANIKVTPEGTVKLLDFGLAKVAEDSPSTNASMSPTLSLAMTQAGMILGTAAYMSPEQARGKPVDKRSDIWAFGVVLFEMLTGTQMFAGGETVTDIIAAVVTREPEWKTLPADTPPHIVRLLRRCLQKDPKLRLRDIGEARIALEEVPAVPEIAPPAPAVVSRRPYIAAAVCGLTALIAGIGWWRATRPVERPLTRFLVDLESGSVRGGQLTGVISPDGRRLVFPIVDASGVNKLGTRLLNEPAASSLDGSEFGTQPFFSPDSQWIGFFTPQELKKVSVHGGAAISLCAISAPPRGATWLPDGTIIANLDNEHLSRLPDSGGKPQVLGEPVKEGERTWRWPQSFGDGRYVMFTGGTGALGTAYENANIKVLDLKTGKVKTVARGGYFPHYLPSGHLIYVHQGTLFAVPFDIDRLETRGSAIPILKDVAGVPAQGGGQLSFSDTGTFIYLNGKSQQTLWSLAWVDPSGKTQPVWETKTAVLSPKISPDGKLLAGTMDDIFQIFDPQRSSPLKLTLAGLGRSCVWSPDGKHLAYSTGAGEGQLAIKWIRADGSTAPVELYRTKSPNLRVTSISADRRHLAFWQNDEAGDPHVMVLPLDLHNPEQPQAGAPEKIAPDLPYTSDGTFSPDGRWIAFTSHSKADLAQVFVRPYPATRGNGQWQVSDAGGSFAVWSTKGAELFYRAPSGNIMSVAYQAKAEVFGLGKPAVWTPIVAAGLATASAFDVAPDGKHILLYPQASIGSREGGQAQVTVLLNFFDELKRRLP
jgi:serine/threonine protein kinase